MCVPVSAPPVTPESFSPRPVALLDFAGGAEVAEVGADAACSTGDGQGAGWELEVGRLLGSYYRRF